MAVQNLPLDYDIVVYSGTNYRREFRWLPDGINPQDFTGWSALMLIGRAGAPAQVALTDTAGLTLTVDGRIEVNLTPAQTATLEMPTGYYNLDLIEPDGFIRRFVRGRVSVVVDVQKPVP